MKRLISMILLASLCLSLSLCIPVFAVADESTSGVKPLDTNDLSPEFSSALIGEDPVFDDNGVLRSIVKTYRFNVPYDGNYYELDTSLALTPGTVSFCGAWFPSYASLTVEIISEDGSYGTLTSVASGVAGTLRIRQAGTYTIRVRAASTTLRGHAQITQHFISLDSSRKPT